MPANLYPASAGPLANEGQAFANLQNALHAYYAQASQPISGMTQQGALAAAIAEVLASTANTPSLQTVTVPIPTTATTARAQVNVDFNPQLAGPNFAIVGVQVIDAVAANGAAGLLFERVLSINAQSATLQFVNQGSGSDSGTALVTVASYTASLSSNPSPDPAVAALRANTTGNIQLFDKRFNQITSGNGLSRWDPVLGTSPPLVGRASHLPTTAGNGNPVFTDGVATGAISSPSSSIYDISQPHSFVYIGRMVKSPTNTTGPFLAGGEITTGGGYTFAYPQGAGLVGSAGFRWEGGGGGTTFVGPSGKALDGLIGMVCVTRNGTSGQYGALPGPLTAFTPSAPTSGAGTLSVGCDTTGTLLCQGETHALIWADHVLSAAEQVAVYNYQMAAHPDPSLTDISIHDGDSQTYGTGLTDLTGNYPTTLIQSAGLSRQLAAVNTGVVAKQLLGAGGLLTTYPTFIAPIFRSGRRNQYLVLWTGTNDFALGSATVAQVLTGIQSYVSLALATGFNPKQIAIMTVLSRGDTNIDTLRDAYNPQCIALCAALGVGCIPLHQDPIMGIDGAWSNGTYFNADHVHPTAAGYTRLVQNFILPFFRTTMN